MRVWRSPAVAPLSRQEPGENTWPIMGPTGTRQLQTGRVDHSFMEKQRALPIGTPRGAAARQQEAAAAVAAAAAATSQPAAWPHPSLEVSGQKVHLVQSRLVLQ